MGDLRRKKEEKRREEGRTFDSKSKRTGCSVQILMKFDFEWS